MKLENQVCTLEQAKKLKEMGVSPDSYFCYSGPKDTFYQGEGAPPIKLIRTLGLYGFYSEYNYYSAYTVAELGVMLPDICLSRRYKRKWTCWTDAYNPGFSGDTEAEARAAMLIYLLENNHTTPEEVNTRLNNQ